MEGRREETDECYLLLGTWYCLVNLIQESCKEDVITPVL